jgi:hypothetical protein
MTFAYYLGNVKQFQDKKGIVLDSDDYDTALEEQRVRVQIKVDRLNQALIENET